MADPVSVEQVRHVARLAKLGLGEEQAQELARDLSTILRHMDVLATVDTSRIAPDDETIAAPLRSDEGPPLPLAAPPEAFAPAMRDGFFLVPRLASHEP